MAIALYDLSVAPSPASWKKGLPIAGTTTSLLEKALEAVRRLPRDLHRPSAVTSPARSKPRSAASSNEAALYAARGARPCRHRLTPSHQPARQRRGEGQAP